MKKYILVLILFSLIINSCRNGNNKEIINQSKKEIVAAELNFSDLARDKGIRNAFVEFASDSAVINRSDSLLKGKVAIGSHYENPFFWESKVSLTWTPDYVDVAQSGELGYTYGHYTFSYLDSLGNRIERKGVFHTVWKKQADGKWKFVWD